MRFISLTKWRHKVFNFFYEEKKQNLIEIQTNFFV